jgi:(2Fe-2S) ferredoxin
VSAATPKSGAGARAARIDAALAAAADKSAYLADDGKAEIRICAGTACHASGRVALREAIKASLEKRGLSDSVRVVETGCHGFCELGPIVVLRPQGLFYPRLKPKDIEEIIATSVVGDGVVERLLYKRPRTGEPLALENDIPFYSLQKRVGPWGLHGSRQGTQGGRSAGDHRRGREERPSRSRRSGVPHRQEVARLPGQPR